MFARRTHSRIYSQKLVTTEAGRLSGKAPADGEGDGTSDVEGDEKKKKQNMGRLLKTRLQKLVEKTDSEYVERCLVICAFFADMFVSAAERCPLNSWSSRVGSIGRSTTRQSSILSAWRTSLCVFLRVH